MAGRMKIGLCFPYYSEEQEPTREFVQGFFRRVDEGPFSSLSCGERIVGPCVELSSTLAAAAIYTNRVRIVPTLYVAPMHSAIWIAKHAAMLDMLSGGRVTITVGTGGRDYDYRAMERVREKPQSRMEAQVAEIRRIWRGEPAFPGKQAVGPKPVQPGGPPILAGVMGPKAIARSARWADGVYSWSGNGNEQELKNQRDQVRSAWQAAKREKPPIWVAGFWYSLAVDAATRLPKYVYDYVVHSAGDAGARAMSQGMNRCTRDAVRASLDAYEELGVEECLLNPVTRDPAEIHELFEVMAKR
jgi:alkanesulfonate monooxygenase SsuD/methylene tetrahydromethanopterin reductase-like flavin-dependent oxidoreductase (luciferase family)